MNDKKKEKGKTVEMEYGEFVLSESPLLQAMNRLFELYIGTEESFAIAPLQARVEAEQKKFIDIQGKLRISIYGDDAKKQPQEAIPVDDLEGDAKKERMKQNVAYSIEFAALCRKKVKIECPDIEISKSALSVAMERELAKGEKGIVLSAFDINFWERFVSFV